MKKAALYTRVSTPVQETAGTSLQSQTDDCRAYAHNQGYSVVMERADVYSGTSMSRQGLEDVLDAARRGDVDVVVCLAIDRSNRDLGDLLAIDRELTRANVALEFVRDPRERTPQGDLFFQIKGAFAQYEHSIITERMRRGKHYTIQQGKVMSGKYTAFGYRADPDTHNLVIQEEEAALVRYMFERLAYGGGTLNRIALELNTLGVPTPQGAKVWRESTVSRIIKSETYAGRWAYNRKKGVQRPRRPAFPTDTPDPDDMVHARVPRPRSEWLIVNVPAIVSEETWQAAQRQLQKNGAQAPRNRKREYLLAGMLYCAPCAAVMYGWQHSTGGKYLYYRCSRHALNVRYLPDYERTECTTKLVRVNAVDTLVWEEAYRQIQDGRLIEAALREAEKDDPSETPLTRARIDSLQKQRAALEKEGERLLDLYLTGDIPKAMYTSRMASIKGRIEAVDGAQGEISAQVAEYQNKVRALYTLSERIAAVREGWPHMEFADRRAFLLGMGVTVSIRRAENPKDGHLVDIDGLLEPVRGIPLPLPQPAHANQWTGPVTHREG